MPKNFLDCYKKLELPKKIVCSYTKPIPNTAQKISTLCNSDNLSSVLNTIDKKCC